MTRKDTPEDLRTELQSLKNTLNNQAENLITEHNNIPVLDDLFEEKSTAETDQRSPNQTLSSQQPEPSQQPSNDEINDKLNQYLNTEKPSSSLQALLERERMVDELVDEVMPIVKNRLKLRLRKFLEENHTDNLK